MKKVLKILLGVVAFIIAILLYPILPDRGECLESHVEQQTRLIPSGKVLIPLIEDVEVCDKWEFPNGKNND